MAADCRASNVPFGFRTVPLDRKQAMVGDVVHRVARRCDLMVECPAAERHQARPAAAVGRSGRFEPTGILAAGSACPDI